LASAITHFIVGASVALPVGSSAMPRWALPVTAGLFAVAPDLDTYAMFAFDIPRGSVLAHRGVFHSAAFLIVLAAAVAFAGVRGRAALTVAAVWSAAAITHPLLDMLTDGGSGVMVLWPFFDERLFFPWRPIRVSPLGVMRFFSRAGEILLSEAPFDAAAVALALAARRVLRMAIR
jgi:inner membrane protein